jgi:hypothetical protein
MAKARGKKMASARAAQGGSGDKDRRSFPTDICLSIVELKGLDCAIENSQAKSAQKAKFVWRICRRWGICRRKNPSCRCKPVYPATLPESHTSIIHNNEIKLIEKYESIYLYLAGNPNDFPR